MPYKGLFHGNRAALARLAAALTTGFGLVALSGWTFELPLLKSVLPGAVEMKANTAVGLVLCGVALLILADRSSLWLERIAQASAAAVAVLGLATLGEYVFGWQLGIDELLFRDTANAYNPFRGRMSPYSAAAFGAIGLALAAVRWPALGRLTQLGAVLVILTGVVSLLGYLWNASELITDRWLPPVAVNTAVAFILLGSGALLAGRTPNATRDRRLRGLAAVEIKILAGFLVALSLLLFGGGYTYRASVEFADSMDWIVHTREVRAALGDLYGKLSAAEWAQRDYLLTADRTRREDYALLVSEVEKDMAKLSRLTAGNPAQQQNLAELRPLLAQRLDALARVLAVYEEQGLSKAQEALYAAAGIRASRAIRVLTQHMDAVEARLLGERSTARVRDTTLVSLLVTLALATAVFIVLFQSIRREMIAREAAERALRASDQYNRSIVESSPDCLMLLTPEGRLSQMTAQGRRLMEVDDFAAIENTDWLAFWQGADRDAAQRALEAARAGSPGRFHGHCPTLAGTPKWWDVIVMPILGADGKTERLLAVARDISEVKRAEAKLLESNSFLDSLIENIPNMIFVKDAADLRFVRFNRAGEQLLGYSKEELIGRNDRDFFPQAEAEFFMAKDRAALAGGGLVDIAEELVHTRHQGVRTLHTMKLPIVDEQGWAKYLLGISEDITERKHADEAIRNLNAELQQKAVQLEATNKELESFSYSVSHDLRAPLRAIDGFALMIEEDYVNRLDAEGRRYLSVIRSNSTRMGQLIDDLLDFSRLGRQPMAKSEVNMETLVHEVIEEALHRRDNIARQIEVMPLPPAQADWQLMRQVWVNLVSNALKYAGKAVQPRIEVSGHRNGAENVYSIGDNGVGFSMDYYDKLFGVFQRMHRADEFSGTGVGLAIVHRVVTRHGGRVWAEGKVGEGAVFSFSLPNGEQHG